MQMRLLVNKVLYNLTCLLPLKTVPEERQAELILR